MKTLVLILAAATLAACSDPQPAANTPASAETSAVETVPAGNDADANATHATTPATTDAASTEADYLGRWTGVEGMYLVVAAKPDGGVTLEMQWDLDNKGTFDGTVTAEGLHFMRGGVAENAVHTNGNATGLKYLAGKKQCLTVKPGEGYCRD
ncbi:hypothetical protein [Thermomonas sp.]|uniref:hypothetical protein n=1 Tax=Thermomonas sp. TaxID=1971895 RepID=UPI002488E803|nr:hypothetical protein [Thermomonas sp.]MDI1254063.1 hypothetical protein [Thermomonas sp.]